MASGAGYRHSVVVTEGLLRYLEEAGPGQNLDMLKRFKWASMGSTIHLVTNCEDVTDWDIEDSSNFNAVNEASDFRVGTNAIELVDAGTTVGTAVTLDSGHRPNDEDWSGFNWLCMFVHDDTAARTAGELTCQIRNSTTWGTVLSVPVTTVDMWSMVCIDISGENRANVDGFRFVNQRGTGSDEKVYIDQIIVTDLITGTGDGDAIGTGPVIGPVRAFPIATGSTILPGDTVEWSAYGVATGTANDARILGVACQNDAFTSKVASDTVPNEVLVACEGSIVWLRNDGTGMAIGEPGILGSDVVTEGAGTAAGNAEYGFCMSLETSSTTAYASGDSAYEILNATTED